jgi:hypothetical protein
MRIPVLLPLLLALPSWAMAGENCKFSAPRQLNLDLTGVRSVRLEVGSHALRINAVRGSAAALSGRACASHADRLEKLTLTQQREGDTLVVKLDDKNSNWPLFGSAYSHLDVSGSLPDNIPLQLHVGSGDAWISGAAELAAAIGSGDADIRSIKGETSLSLGSGDVQLHDVGTLQLSSIGSGDVKAEHVRDNVEVGSIGSGDLELNDISKAVRIGSIGSGDASLGKVQGAISIGSIGSGNADVRDSQGSVTVASIGSGDLTVHRIGGDLHVSNKGIGSIHQSEVKGRVHIPNND